jgi:hypothetical protein
MVPNQIATNSQTINDYYLLRAIKILSQSFMWPSPRVVLLLCPKDIRTASIGAKHPQPALVLISCSKHKWRNTFTFIGTLGAQSLAGTFGLVGGVHRGNSCITPTDSAEKSHLQVARNSHKEVRGIKKTNWRNYLKRTMDILADFHVNQFCHLFMTSWISFSMYDVYSGEGLGTPFFVG